MNDTLLQFLFTLLASFGGASDIPPVHPPVVEESAAVTCHLEYTDPRTIVASVEASQSRNIDFVFVTSSAANAGEPDSQDGELDIEAGERTQLAGARFRVGEPVTASLTLTWDGGATDCRL